MTASPAILSIVEAAYVQHFKTDAVRAAVSFLGVEQIEILRFAGDRRDAQPGDVDHYLSLGMSRYPMGDPAAPVVDQVGAARAELMMSARSRPEGLWRQLAVLAAAPAVEAAVYSAADRVDLGQPLCPGSRCTGGVLSGGPMPPILVAGIADVSVLLLVPATQTELAWARVHGSAALRERWQSAETDLTDLLRDPVGLDWNPRAPSARS